MRAFAKSPRKNQRWDLCHESGAATPREAAQRPSGVDRWTLTFAYSIEADLMRKCGHFRFWPKAKVGFTDERCS